MLCNEEMNNKEATRTTSNDTMFDFDARVGLIKDDFFLVNIIKISY